MVKRFFKDSAIYGFGKLLTYGIGFFLIPIYTRVFPPAEFGLVDLLTTLARLALLTVALEIAQALLRFLPETASPDERVTYASTALWFSLAAYALFVAVGWLGAEFFSRLLLDEAGRAAEFRLTLLMICANGLFTLFQNQLRWQAKARHYTLVSVVDTVVSLGLTILFIVFLNLGVIGVFWGQIAGLVAGIALGAAFTRGEFRFRFSPAKLAEMLRFSLPLVPSGVALFVYLYVDRLTINSLMTIADVGIFGVGYRIASIVSLLMFGFQVALMPLIYTHYREPETPPSLARIFRYFVALVLLMIVGLSLFAPEILRLLTTPQYFGAAAVVPLLVPATVLAGLYIFAPGLGIARRTGIIALVNIGGALLNTVLNLALIPLLGIQGAALATLLSTAVVFGAFMTFSQRHYPVPHQWGKLAVGLFTAAVIVIIGLQITLPAWPGIALKLGLCAAAALAFWFIGLFPPHPLSLLRPHPANP